MGGDGWTHVRDAPSRTRGSWKRFGGRFVDDCRVSAVISVFIAGGDRLVGERPSFVTSDVVSS